MRIGLLLLVLGIWACGSSPSGPAGKDPTVLIINELRDDSVFFTWRDGQGVVGSDVVLPGQTACEKFLARADSAYFHIEARDQQNGGAFGTLTAPWFDPAGRPAWTITVRHASNGSPDILDREVSPAPC